MTVDGDDVSGQAFTIGAFDGATNSDGVPYADKLDSFTLVSP